MIVLIILVPWMQVYCHFRPGPSTWLSAFCVSSNSFDYSDHDRQEHDMTCRLLWNIDKLTADRPSYLYKRPFLILVPIYHQIFTLGPNYHPTTHRGLFQVRRLVRNF